MFQALALIILALPLDSPEPAHASNLVYREIVGEGVRLGETPIRLPAPRLIDGQTPEAQRKALAELAGGERAAEDLLRDSVNAPFVLKVRDEKTPAGDTIRQADLVFVVHAPLDVIEPAETARQAAKAPAEAANMRVETMLLGSGDLNALKIPPPEEGREWYARMTARLLDRIQVTATDHVVVSRSADSLVMASRTDPRFGQKTATPNAWTTLARDGTPGSEPQPYEGGMSYTKISRMAGAPTILVVEAHFAFVEPKAWFDGAPVLRSKFAPVAQDQIRRLRRQVKERKP
ncbi:hypothetical protein EP7_003108 [Isosphaeraceae bacterium EP7]